MEIDHGKKKRVVNPTRSFPRVRGRIHRELPEEVRDRLHDIRKVVRDAAPGSTETVSYFQMPGYLHEGYDDNAMFAWFSFKAPDVCLHLRPPVLEDHAPHLGDYATTKAIVSFPMDKAIPQTLVKKLVRASVRVMKQKQERQDGSSFQRLVLRTSSSETRGGRAGSIF